MSSFFSSRNFTRAMRRGAICFIALALPLLPASTRLVGAQDYSRDDMGSRSPNRVVRGEVVVVAQALDSNRVIKSARFILDGRTLAEVGPPGRYLWDTRGAKAGRHLLQVQAFCEDGFVGLSDPFAIMIEAEDAAASTREIVSLPFTTYGVDARRGEVAPPSAPQPGYAGVVPPRRDQGLTVEVYLNGVRQNFVPAAHLASIGVETRSRSHRIRFHGRRASTRAATTTRRTVWLPARPLLERLGAQVRFEKRDQTMRAELDVAGVPRRIVMKTDSATRSVATYAVVRGHSSRLDVPVRRSGNGFMVPLDFCRQALNLSVRWPAGTRRVDLFTAISPM